MSTILICDGIAAVIDENLKQINVKNRVPELPYKNAVEATLLQETIPVYIEHLDQFKVGFVPVGGFSIAKTKIANTCRLVLMVKIVLNNTGFIDAIRSTTIKKYKTLTSDVTTRSSDDFIRSSYWQNNNKDNIVNLDAKFSLQRLLPGISLRHTSTPDYNIEEVSLVRCGGRKNTVLTNVVVAPADKISVQSESCSKFIELFTLFWDAGHVTPHIKIYSDFHDLGMQIPIQQYKLQKNDITGSCKDMSHSTKMYQDVNNTRTDSMSPSFEEKMRKLVRSEFKAAKRRGRKRCNSSDSDSSSDEERYRSKKQKRTKLHRYNLENSMQELITTLDQFKRQMGELKLQQDNKIGEIKLQQEGKLMQEIVSLIPTLIHQQAPAGKQPLSPPEAVHNSKDEQSSEPDKVAVDNVDDITQKALSNL